MSTATRPYIVTHTASGQREATNVGSPQRGEMPGKAPAMGQNLSCFTEAAEVLGATMKRQDAIALMRIAGYHSDSRSFARLFLENRVNKATADEAYVKGQQQRSAGMGCHCFKCKEAQQQQLPSNPR